MTEIYSWNAAPDWVRVAFNISHMQNLNSMVAVHKVANLNNLDLTYSLVAGALAQTYPGKMTSQVIVHEDNFYRVALFELK